MTADHDRMEDAVAAYALDACDDEERDLVRAHLDGCASCRELLRRLDRAVDALPLASDEVRPPDRLRSRILSAAAAPPGAEPEPAAAPRIVALPQRGEPPAPAGRRFPFPVYGAAVAALAVGLVALAAWNVALNQQLNSGPSRYAVTGTGTMAGAGGMLYASNRQDLAVLSLTGVPQPQPGRVYEVWLIDAAGRATPSGVFTPGPDGSATVGINRPLEGVKTVAVTQEAGPMGTQAPTQAPELAGRLA